MKKSICLILCLALVFSLVACTGNPAPTETTVPPTTTEPAPVATDVYAAAADQVSQAGGVKTYTIKKEITVGSDTYLEKEKSTLLLSGTGTDAFSASAVRTFSWGDGAHEVMFNEAFSGGTYYGSLSDSYLSCEMTAEDYLARYLPTALFTPELYATVELVDASTVSFSGATEAEPWLNAEFCELVEASGTATINAAGELDECTYHVIFKQGGVINDWTIDLSLTTGTTTPSLPEDTAKYASAENPDVHLLYERAFGMLIQAHDFTTVSSSNVVVQAGLALLTEQMTINGHGSGKDLMAQFDYSVSLMDLSTQKVSYAQTQQEIFRDGVYSFSTDGGAAQTNNTITSDTIEMTASYYLTTEYPAMERLAHFGVKDLGTVSLLEFTFNEDGSHDFTTLLCGMIYEDENLLNDLASAYRTETAEGFIGIDNITGLPTMIGTTYAGVHTIDGQEYTLAYEATQSYTFGTGSGYETITGELLPPVEPENKATPLLYHVTGENGEEMWLFGTIHVGDTRTAYLPQELLDAFAASDALALEFDSDSFETQLENDPELLAKVQQYYFYTDGTTTEAHLHDKGLWNSAVELLKATGNYYSTVPLMKPSIISNTIENAYLAQGRILTGEYGADNQLMALAQKQGKEILSVESAEFQIEMLTGFSDSLQELLLQEALEMNPADHLSNAAELFELWCSGDEAALTAYINTEADTSELTEEELALYEEYWNAMSTNRNDDMLAVAEGYLTGDRVVFYAVGLAHLLAEDGLVNTLRNAGYTVELVIYQ